MHWEFRHIISFEVGSVYGVWYETIDVVAQPNEDDFFKPMDTVYKDVPSFCCAHVSTGPSIIPIEKRTTNQSRDVNP